MSWLNRRLSWRRAAARPVGLLERAPTQDEINSACLYMNHAFGLIDEARRKPRRFAAAEWLHAWRKVDEDSRSRKEKP